MFRASQILPLTQDYSDWLLTEETIEGSDDSWKKRWCVLRHLQMDIYKSPKELEPMRSYALASVKELAFGTTIAKTKQFGFSFTTADDGVIRLSAESEEEREEWVGRLRKLVPIAKIEATQYQEALETIMRDSYRIRVYSSLRPYIDNLKASLEALKGETDTITKVGLPAAKITAIQVTLTVDATNSTLAKISSTFFTPTEKEHIQSTLLDKVQVIVEELSTLLTFAKSLSFQNSIRGQVQRTRDSIIANIDSLLKYLQPIEDRVPSTPKDNRWSRVVAPEKKHAATDTTVKAELPKTGLRAWGSAKPKLFEQEMRRRSLHASQSFGLEKIQDLQKTLESIPMEKPPSPRPKSASPLSQESVTTTVSTTEVITTETVIIEEAPLPPPEPIIKYVEVIVERPCKHHEPVNTTTPTVDASATSTKSKEEDDPIEEHIEANTLVRAKRDPRKLSISKVSVPATEAEEKQRSRRGTTLDVAALSASEALNKFLSIKNLDVSSNLTPALRALKEKFTATVSAPLVEASDMTSNVVSGDGSLNLDAATSAAADALGKFLNLKDLLSKLSNFEDKLKAKQLAKVSGQKVEGVLVAAQEASLFDEEMSQEDFYSLFADVKKGMGEATSALDSALSSLLLIKFPESAPKIEVQAKPVETVKSEDVNNTLDNKDPAPAPAELSPVAAKPQEVEPSEDVATVRARKGTLISTFDSFLDDFNRQLNINDANPSSLYCGRQWSNTIVKRPDLQFSFLSDESKRTIEEVAKTAFDASATLVKTSGSIAPVTIPPARKLSKVERLVALQSKIQSLEEELAKAKEELVLIS